MALRLVRKCEVDLRDNVIHLNVARIPNDEAWPHSIVFGTEVGLTRLSGHAFYELVWDGGNVSGTSIFLAPLE